MSGCIVLTNEQFKELARLRSDFSGNMLLNQQEPVSDTAISATFASPEDELHVLVIEGDGRIERVV